MPAAATAGRQARSSKVLRRIAAFRVVVRTRAISPLVLAGRVLPRKCYLDGREPIEVRSKCSRDGAGQRHSAVPVSLGQAEYQPGANEFDLADDVQPARVEVDVIDGETENFALTEPATGAQVHGHPVPLGEGRQRHHES
ncbi:hypothetical protein SAMN04489832_3159 [Micromonospora cremea]|uniref:Uncharacterized protein n=1 Tax=Micromonospora cremea TaxID=709881 RepID=A0A1N5YQX1_9ACTN|nr:hypothetical protein SAMN04489832_3159 [Micromonospora cremea]